MHTRIAQTRPNFLPLSVGLGRLVELPVGSGSYAVFSVSNMPFIMPMRRLVEQSKASKSAGRAGSVDSARPTIRATCMPSASIPSAIDFPSTITYYGGPRPRPDMTADFHLWQQQVRLALQALKEVGAPSQPGSEPISFQQAMRQLYADSHFSAFVSSRAWQQAGLDERAEQELQKLQQLLNTFEEPDSDDLLAPNPAWQCILAQAETVAMLLLAPAAALAAAK